MSYGLKYRLSFDSVSGTPYEINILEAGYDGPVEKRNLGSAPVLKMDDGEAVRGTSLELSIETCFDGDLREFYTTDRKKFRVEVYRSGVLFWSGHILPELYSEPYISVPFDVSVTASDGLGLLKNIPFGLSGKRSVFDVIKYCCEQTGLVLNYVFASKLLATGMSGVASVYTQAFVDCNAFDDADCYEALEKVLITFGSYIKQKDCKWHVLRYTDQDTDLMEYDPSCNFAGGFRPVMKTLGAIGDDTYPVGQLESEIVPARKDFTMEQPYELYPSLLKDYCFAAVGSWILSPGVRFMRVDEETYCELKPTKLPEKLEAYVMQSISVEACNRPFRIEFQFSICLMSNREIGSIDMSTGRSFRLEIFITDSGGTRHYLSAEGWGTKETYIEVRGDVQNGKLRITDGVNYDYIPASFETFRINLERIPYSGEMAFRIVNPYKYYTVPGTPALDDYNDMNIICLKEFVFTSDVDGNPDVNVLLNPEASTSAPSLKVGFVDAPFTENARGIFKNILMTSGGFTSEWYCRGSGLDSFANIALQDMSSRIGVPSFCLHGVIHATDFDLLSDKYSGRKLYLKEYSYDLMEEEIDCTLCELLPFNAGIDGEITQSPRSSNKSKTETRASGETEYRSYGGTISTPKMIRELVSMPDDQLSEGCLLEVDDRMSVSSKRVTVGGLTDLSYKRVLQSGVFWTKEEMNCTDGYLEVQGEKIKAGDSDKWNAHEFDDFLDQPVRKTDSVQFKQVTADKITTDEIISDNFVSGPLGEGMNLIRRDSSGKSYLEIDKIFARYKAVFAALEIRKLTYAGGNYIFSPAGATCTMVEDKEGFYRCYFTADDGEKAVENLFRTDDFVQCRESNIKSGTYENISNRYYWRRCIATGDDYIDLSKSDCDTDSDIPAIGDSMVTIGNKTVSTRQNAIIISVYGEGSPSFIQYKGINTFSLEGKAKIIISPDQNRFTGKFTFETGEDAEESIGNIQNNLDNLQVGETNLLDNSNKGWKNTGYPIATIYLGDYKPKQGEECTIVIKGKLGANKTSWGVYNSGGNVFINGKMEERVIALPKNYLMEQPKDKGKLLGSLDKEKLLGVTYNFTNPQPFLDAGESLVDLNGKEIPANTDWSKVWVLCQTPDTFWRVQMEDELKFVQVNAFKSVQEYFQAIGSSIVYSRQPNKVEQLGIAAQASGDQVYQKLYDFAKKNGLALNAASLYLGVKTKGEYTLRLMTGDTSVPEIKIGRPVEDAQRLYDAIALTLGKNSAAKRYPIKVTSYFEKQHGWKSHATLTLLATQDLPTFGYNMIDPLKSWCWGSILFYPFKISRFS